MVQHTCHDERWSPDIYCELFGLSFSHSKHRFFHKASGAKSGKQAVVFQVDASASDRCHHGWSLSGGIPTRLKNMSSWMGRMTYHIYILYEMENKTYLKPPTRPYLFHTSSKRRFSISRSDHGHHGHHGHLSKKLVVSAITGQGCILHGWRGGAARVFSGSKRSWASWECAGGLYGYDMLW